MTFSNNSWQKVHTKYNLYEHKYNFPGGPVVKILNFHCRGCGFDFWSGKLPEVWPKKRTRTSANVLILTLDSLAEYRILGWLHFSCNSGDIAPLSSWMKLCERVNSFLILALYGLFFPLEMFRSFFLSLVNKTSHEMPQYGLPKAIVLST